MNSLQPSIACLTQSFLNSIIKRLWVLAILFFLAEAASAQTPANNNFSNRISLSGATVSTSGSNVNATSESGEPFNYSGRSSVWWTWTAPASGSVTIRTAGSNFDTTLAAFTGSSVAALTQIASNDDADGALQSRIDFTATAGVAYQIQVSGYGSTSVGSINLSITQSGSATAPTIASHPASTTVNSGSATTLSVTATGTAPLTYQWYQGSSGSTTTPVGSNSASFTTPSLSATTSYWVRVSNSAGSASSNTATVTVNAPVIAPSITSQPASITINSGATTTLSVTASGTAPLSYQWYQGASGTTTTPVGTNSSSFTTPALTSNTSYWVRVSNTAGSVNSNSALVTVIVPPSITSHPSSSAVNYSSSVTLSVSANGTTPLTFQWYQGSSGTTTNPVGTNSSSFTTPALTSNTSYWVRVSNSAGNASSNTATITVGPPSVAPSITTQPVSLSINSGSTANLSVVATGTAPLSYQWYQGPLGTTTNPVGANSSSFTTSALTTNTSYWVRVSNSIGSVDSILATVSVIVPPSITSQPASTEVDYSSFTTLSVSAVGTGPLSYQWYQGSSGTTTNPVGTNSSSFTTPALTSNTSYWVRVSNPAGNASSNTATITVGPPPVAPSITTQPASISINSGSTANLSVVATGTSPLSYQWYQGPLGTTTNPVGTNSSSFTTPALTTNTSYWVRVSNSIGSVDSNLATVSVIVPPSITSHPSSSEVDYSSSATLSVSADGTGPLSYQWYQGSSGTTSSPVGSDSPSFTTPTLTSAASYWVRVSNSAGNASSDTAIITVGPPPVAPSITTQPASTSVSLGNMATFSVIATGTGELNYQWYQGTSGTTTTPVGSNSASFTTPALTTTTSTASYWVRVSNFVGAVNSSAATVTITVPVNIPDPALLAALRIALAKTTGDITDADLLTLTNLNIANKGITNLSGLEKATNLRVLDVRRNNFTDIEGFWTILDSLRLYCLYVDVRRPGVDPVGLVTQTLTDTFGNTFFVTVDAPNLPTLDFTSLSVDTTNPTNISALQTISSSGVTVDTGGINLPPFANAVASVVNQDTRQVLLSASGSSDVDGTITAYAWSWSGGSASAATATVTLPYGTTSVTLTVADNLGASGSSTVMVTIDRPYTDPAITNLSAVQRAGTRLVDIRYDVDAVTPMVATSVRVSSDRGVTFAVPAATLSGHFGPGVAPGSGKTITWDAGADWPEQFSETVRFEVGADDRVGTPADMALIPAGNFTMGRTSGDTDADAPPVEVTVSAFYMGKNEVTKALWDEVRTWAVANGYTDLATGEGKAADHPVHTITWFDMVKWCNARSQKEGLTPSYTVSGAVMKAGTMAPTVDWTANGYRLPTEAEWEKAARGGKRGKRFPWGTDTISHGDANYTSVAGSNFDVESTPGPHPTYGAEPQPYTSPVGVFAPNAYGLHDMAGNVWEWCWDGAGSTYANGATDPRGASSGTGRIRRGGAWASDSGGCRIAGRFSLAPSGAENLVGFRLARTPVAAVIPPRITIQPASMTTVDSGVTLTVAATGTRLLTYQWYQGPVGTTTNPVGTNSPTYTTLPWTPTTSYWVRVSNAAGSVDSVAAVVDDFSQIPGGGFTMGRTSGDTDGNAPPVTVTLSGFYMGKNEVSKELWDEVRTWALANGYVDISEGEGKGPDHPVHSVSWWDVVKWCNARSEKEGLSPCYMINFYDPVRSDDMLPSGDWTADWSANGYRLPTEAEWEKAARGGVSGKRFPWGADAISHANANFNNNGSQTYQSGTTGFHPDFSRETQPFTSPVGSFSSYGYGLNDMAGNLAEWCWDLYGFSAYLSGWNYDPRGPSSGINRVVRGGSWDLNASYCRASNRYQYPPYGGGQRIGFRLARSSVPSGPRPPAISMQPGSTSPVLPGTISIIRGESATLTVSAGGANPLTYQWYQGSVGVTTTPVGTNAASFTTPALNVSRSYWVRVSNAAGTVNSVLATVSVINPPAITTQPASTTIPSGQTATLTVTSSGTAPLTYQWYEGAVGTTTTPVGTNAANFTTATLTATTTYWVRVSNSAGNVNSALATVTVNPPVIAPSITTQPASTTINSGSTADLSVVASGTAPLTYQWYQGAVGTTTSPIGTNSASFTTVTLSATTSYWVRVSNAAGTVDSTLATVTALAPAITTQPVSTTINSNSTADLSVVASGTAPLSYQWYQGAVGTTTSPVGTNSSTYTTSALTATTSYWVRVSNTAGTVDSTLATVTVGSTTPTDLALIPAGAFTMGSTSGDTDSNAPSVSVTVSAFYMGKNEVTKALWDEVRTWAIANGYTDLATGAVKAADHPVQTVSWWDVIKWCNARSEKEGLTPCYTVSGAVMKTGTTSPTVNWSANGYRLPTEAEWEKAARDGVSGKRFPWGTDTISHSQANYNNGGGEAYQTGTTGYHPSYATGSTPYTSPVGAFAANAYGLHDMAGNVLEWCWDWYGASTYVNGATDPRGANSGSVRVLRGGSWDYFAYYCRAALRFNRAPSAQGDVIGFRIARSSVDQPMPAPSIAAQPVSTTITSDSTTTLSVTVSGTGPFTYQWYQGAVGVTTTPVGTNSASVATPALSETTTYWVRITNAAGSVDSGLATVTVNPPVIAPSITTQPVSTTITSGQTATLTVTASGTSPLTYQWYQGAVGTTTSPVGTNSASFTTATLTATTTYWVRVSNSAGNVNSTLATVTVGGSTPTDLALIPAGAFTMGRTSGDTDTDAPPVSVTVSAFYMGKNEVTKALWDEVRTWGAANGYSDLAAGAGKAANHPAQTISWWDVIKWCNARSQKEGLTPVYTVSGAVMKSGTTAPTVNWSANGYRLPTEAEWEKAARGGVSGKRFPWGTDTISHSQANYYASTSYSYDSSGAVNNYHPSYVTGSFPYTSPVGAFAANAYGLHDMAGNVWEWCWDWYGSYSNGATDPRGAASGSSRVFRGGSWGYDAFGCRAAGRGYYAPSYRFNFVGFRIARSSVP